MTVGRSPMACPTRLAGFHDTPPPRIMGTFPAGHRDPPMWDVTMDEVR
jgi:hypothetical protein